MNTENLNELAEYIIEAMKKAGVHVLRYNAYSTNSIYLKFDYGLANSLRISDHPGKKHLSYMFNLITGYTGNRVVRDKYTRYFFNETQTRALITQLLYNRDRKMQKFGDYEKSMQEHKESNICNAGFWRVAWEV